jgi:predicted permease
MPQPSLSLMINDIRYAIRTLRNNLGFALVAILSLALGIGLNAAIFSVADALLLRPLPVPNPSQVVSVRSQHRGDSPGGMSYRDYLDYRSKTKSFEDLAAMQVAPVGFAKSKGELPQMKPGLICTGNIFRVLHVEPRIGRDFRPDEDQVPGRDAVAVISYDFWKNEFGASPDAIGKTVFVNGIDFTIIGVTPESFTGIDQYFRPDIYIPTMMEPRLAGTPERNFLEKRDDRGLIVKGRLKPRVSLASANAEARLIAKWLEAAYPETNRNFTAAVRTEFQVRVDQSPYDAILAGLLLGLVGIVLLIACANVANLLLSRARARSREIAIRLAIGAGRWRLVRQLLTESLVIALAGCAVGLVVGRLGVDLFSRVRIVSEIPIVFDVRMDSRVVLYALLAALVSAAVFGLAPALQATKTNLVPALKSGTGNGDGKRRRLLGRNTLVIAQVAGSLLLLVCATQLLRATYFLLSTPPGFRTNHILMVTFDPTLVRYTPAQTQNFYKSLVERARAVPGVKSAALTRVVPMSNMFVGEAIVPEGFQLPPGKENVGVFANTVGGGYFDTIGTPILQGRAFQAADTADSPRVAVVNEWFVRHYFPNLNPVGKRFWIGSRSGPAVEIVGVAKRSKYQSLVEPPIDAIYLPLSQNPQTRMTLLAESYGNSASLVGPIREAVRALDPNQPIYSVRTMEEYFKERGTKIVSMLTEMTGLIGLLGLTLALVGLYGLMSYSVSRRTREIGIRMAIGADRSGVVRMVLKQGLLLTGIGVAVGALASLAFGRALTAGMGIPSFDLRMFLAVPLALLAMAALSAYVPARRASRVNPVEALRLE